MNSEKANKIGQKPANLKGNHEFLKLHEIEKNSSLFKKMFADLENIHVEKNVQEMLKWFTDLKIIFHFLRSS